MQRNSGFVLRHLLLAVLLIVSSESVSLPAELNNPLKRDHIGPLLAHEHKGAVAFAERAKSQEGSAGAGVKSLQGRAAGSLEELLRLHRSADTDSASSNRQTVDHTAQAETQLKEETEQTGSECKETFVRQFAKRVDGDKKCHKVVLLESCDGKTAGSRCDTTTSVSRSEERCIAVKEDPSVCFCRNMHNLKKDNPDLKDTIEKDHTAPLEKVALSKCRPTEHTKCHNTLVPGFAKHSSKNKDKDGTCQRVKLMETCDGNAPGDECDTDETEAKETCISTAERLETCFCRAKSQVKDMDEDANVAPLEVLSESCKPTEEELKKADTGKEGAATSTLRPTGTISFALSASVLSLSSLLLFPTR
uniref:Uncharacterized protein n=1 Tax=Chromera velia CCMP2878 TaxID=1169474 RepID=A0A0G4H9Q3_9ALVE|eukprot:Cvel_5972.t1-p1 / transcript=Cvel_5972.t1 / gene=Cvel_5972 / organism=Chromera_velia_CCMP2878 / gene_product=hypothetical protein / transcript_product=hypothetical protein / location=Cvel_scaffold286:17756-18838(-) / protein_length=361 / sequence_SO=supercontig / SO=protein_coding / is_pseudo=false